MQSGSWRNQAGPSHSQPHPSDAASPSSSSSHATPVPGHLGREAIQQQQLLLLQQQQLAQRQAFEQQEPQKQVARIEQHYAQNPVHQAFLQYALQTSQNRPSENIMNQQGKMSTASSGNQGMFANNLIAQERASLQTANHSQSSILNQTGDHFSHTERQLELGNIVSGQRNDPKPSQIAAGQLVPTNMCGERNLPPEVLRAIAGLPADSLPQQSLVQSGAGLQERTSAMEEMHTQMDEGLQPVLETGKGNHNVHTKGDNCNEKGKAVSVEDASASIGQEKKPAYTRDYHNPLFDFSSFTRKHDLLGSTTPTSNDMALVYDVKDLLLDELHQQQQEKFVVQDRLAFLNTASIEELTGLKEIGKKRATYILELRKKTAEPFMSIDDLREFGLSTKQINAMIIQVLGDF